MQSTDPVSETVSLISSMFSMPSFGLNGIVVLAVIFLAVIAIPALIRLTNGQGIKLSMVSLGRCLMYGAGCFLVLLIPFMIGYWVRELKLAIDGAYTPQLETLE